MTAPAPMAKPVHTVGYPGASSIRRKAAVAAAEKTAPVIGAWLW